MNPRRKPGLTLVELLVVLSLLTLVIGAVIATLTGGFQVWERAQALGMHGQWAQVVFEQIRGDLSNARAFDPIGFKGEYDGFSFPTLVRVQLAQGDVQQEVEELGRVGYFWNSADRTLYRSRHSYRVVRRYSVKDLAHPVLMEVTRARFHYYGFNPEQGAYDWSDRWEKPALPLAVKMEISYPNGPTHQERTQAVLIPLPAAQTQKR